MRGAKRNTKPMHEKKSKFQKLAREFMTKLVGKEDSLSFKYFVEKFPEVRTQCKS